MLRITITNKSAATTVVLDGRLAGPWVDELARCWSTLLAAPCAGTIGVRLEGVTFVDDAGKVLLKTIHAEGGALEAAGCMTRAIVEDITARKL